jgi:hypothetical protein
MGRNASPHQADAPDLDWTASVEPARVFNDPDDVLQADCLTPEEKRAILAAWASDACAVEAAPGLRNWPGSRMMVPVRRILEALLSLDASPSGCPGAWTIAGRASRGVASVRTAKTL